jgi:hypothetical protein
MNQMTLSFEAELPDRFPTLREFVAHRAMMVAKPLKVQAADLDIGVSTLSRKLHPGDGDTQRFNCDDLEAWIQSTEDGPAVISYLCAKYMQGDQDRRALVLMRVESLMRELERAVVVLKAPGA